MAECPGGLPVHQNPQTTWAPLDDTVTRKSSEFIGRDISVLPHESERERERERERVSERERETQRERERDSERERERVFISLRRKSFEQLP